jgi:hypothetical protein
MSLRRPSWLGAVSCTRDGKQQQQQQEQEQEQEQEQQQAAVGRVLLIAK